jgi:hypothetical protein
MVVELLEGQLVEGHRTVDGLVFRVSEAVEVFVGEGCVEIGVKDIVGSALLFSDKFSDSPVEIFYHLFIFELKPCTFGLSLNQWENQPVPNRPFQSSEHFFAA